MTDSLSAAHPPGAGQALGLLLPAAREHSMMQLVVALLGFMTYKARGKLGRAEAQRADWAELWLRLTRG